jgi:CBS domain-containing protein
MQTVQHLLDHKGWGVWSIAPDASVHEALSLLAAHNVGAVVVTRGERLVGILSERDCVRRVMLAQLPASSTRVADVMTAPVTYVKTADSVERCMRIMTDQRVRHLPVLDGERVVGMISVGDVVKAQLSEQQALINDLESYISGSPVNTRPPLM